MPRSTHHADHHHRCRRAIMPAVALQCCILLFSSVLAVAAATRPLIDHQEQALMHTDTTYQKLTTKPANKDQQVMGTRKNGGGSVIIGKELENCLPKGHRLSSAPSRYINYHIFGSLPDDSAAATAAERACSSSTTTTKTDRRAGAAARSPAGDATDIVHRNAKAP